MDIFHQLEAYKDKNKKAILTIGNFDGIHLGHQAILSRVRELAKEKNQDSVVLTFDQHPSKILRPQHPVHLLCMAEHKIKLFREWEIDKLFILPFTKSFADQTAEEFLQKVFTYINFDSLILGADAAFGRNKEGDQEKVKEIVKSYSTDVEYQNLVVQGKIVSSSLIREFIQKGQFKQAEQLLGRPYSIYSRAKKSPEGFTVDVQDLCLPPNGCYKVHIFQENRTFEGWVKILKTTETQYVILHEEADMITSGLIEVILIGPL